MLALRLLGELEVIRDGGRIALPPSKKTRALLSYLAATAKPHRRERLCSIFWEIPDDPRGALRWSLSRIRALVDEPGSTRIDATREAVAFRAEGADIDLFALRNIIARGFPALSREGLQAAAEMFRGEFLEGMDLPDAHDFQAWLLAEREDLRRLQARILTALLGQLASVPQAALPYARQLAQIDPFNEAARGSLLQILVALGRLSEAEQHYDAAVRLFRELGNGSETGLMRTWRNLRDRARAPAAGEEPESSLAASSEPPRPPSDTEMIGRQAEWQVLRTLLDTATRERRIAVALVTGEPGVGKSRMIEELFRHAQRHGARTLFGRAYEAERNSPFGPWIEVLESLRTSDTSEPLPFDAIQPGPDEAPQATRNRMFAAVMQAVLAGNSDQPAVIALDSMQWCDDASADLLHFMVRSNRSSPMLIALTARDGELADNPAMLGVLRSLRQARLIKEIELSPLSPDDALLLARSVAPGAEAARIAEQSGGNPLFAIELARNAPDRGDELPRSLKESVRDRLERLPAPAADTLRWASVLGTAFRTDVLALLVPIPLDELAAALETLERHGLLREKEAPVGIAEYAFSHDLVHRAIYTAISEPRRRLMHLKAAQSLQKSSPGREAVATDIANHAALGGDDGMAASACVAAARRCLRLFANAEAEALARRGIHYAETLAEPERVMRLLELTQVEMLAHRPHESAAAIARIEELAERAIDHGCAEHARIGFHMLSHLRWEQGLWSDARRDTLRAEFVSRSADDRQQVVAMAEAARCLAMLERDLGQAEALALEAKALGQRLGLEPNALADAMGMLRQHQGEIEEAASQLERARNISRRDGERTSEFFALEHLTVLEMQRGRHEAAAGLCAELTSLGERLRHGSEAPFARALDAICSQAMGRAGAEADLDRAVASLRLADSKHRLSIVLLFCAQRDIDRGALDLARERAAEALELSTVLLRNSDILAARSLLAEIAARKGDTAAFEAQAAEIRAVLGRPVSHYSRQMADKALRAMTVPAAGKPRSVRT